MSDHTLEVPTELQIKRTVYEEFLHETQGRIKEKVIISTLQTGNLIWLRHSITTEIAYAKNVEIPAISKLRYLALYTLAFLRMSP